MTTDHIAEFLTHLADRGHPASTIETYGTLLRYVHRQLPYGLPCATGEELRPWVLDPTRSAATRALRRTAVRTFFVWATDPADPRVDHDPTAHLPRVPVPARRARPITTEQLHVITATAREPYRTWCVLAAYAGLRCVEISRLHREHVTVDWVTVRGKGGRERQVPTDALVWDAVSVLPAGPVALAPGGRPATRQDVTRLANYHLRRLAAPGVTMHRLRHWFGTYAHRATRDLMITKELLGHVSVATTQIYVAVDTADLRAAVSTLPR